MEIKDFPIFYILFHHLLRLFIALVVYAGLFVIYYRFACCLLIEKLFSSYSKVPFFGQ